MTIQINALPGSLIWDVAPLAASYDGSLLSISADREFTKALGGLALTLDPKTGALSRPGLLTRLGLG